MQLTDLKRKCPFGIDTITEDNIFYSLDPTLIDGPWVEPVYEIQPKAKGNHYRRAEQARDSQEKLNQAENDN